MSVPDYSNSLVIKRQNLMQFEKYLSIVKMSHSLYLQCAFCMYMYVCICA